MIDDLTRGHAPPSLKGLVAIALGVPTMIFAIMAWHDRDVLMRAAEETTRHASELMEQRAGDMLQAQDLIAARADDRVHGMSWDAIAGSEAVHRYLREILQDEHQARSVWLLDATGAVRNGSTVVPAASPGIVDRGTFDALRRGPSGALVARLRADRSTGDPTDIAFVRHRTGSGGGFDGLIVVTFPARYLADLWRKALPARDSVAGLLATDGEMLVSGPPTPADVVRPSWSQALHQAAADPGRSPVRAASAGGAERFYAGRRLDNYPASVAVGIGTEGVLEQWHLDLAAYAGLFGLAALATTMVAVLALRSADAERVAWRRVVQEAERCAAMERELREAQKMEVVGQLTGSMAHDFGNVLAGIAMHLSTMCGRGDDPRREAAAQAALRAIEQGTKPVLSLLNFVRRQPACAEIVDLNACLADVEQLLRHAVAPLSQLALDLEPDLGRVKVDAQQVELAILNLATNARDAMPAGGTLRISTRRIRLHGEPAGLFGDFVALAAKDTGTGMNSAVLARAFEPLFTTKPVGKGTGLGLSQVRRFALRSGGAVTIDSKLGRGTTVTIYLIAAEERRNRIDWPLAETSAA